MALDSPCGLPCIGHALTMSSPGNPRHTSRRSAEASVQLPERQRELVEQGDPALLARRPDQRAV